MTGCAVLVSEVAPGPKEDKQAQVRKAGCGESRLSGVRREARCSIPAGSRRIEEVFLGYQSTRMRKLEGTRAD